MSDKVFTIFVVEDNEWYNKLLVHNLSMNPDFVVKAFHTGQELLDALHEQPNIVTVDYRLPDMNGEELLRKIKSVQPQVEVIVISEQEAIETAVELLKSGANDYLVKSKDIRNRLLHSVDRIRENEGLKSKIVHLQKEVQGKYAFQNSIVGNSPALKRVFDLIHKATATNITVSITGETGTGKEVVAKAIHYNSARKDQPFVAVNMAALPPDLIESELFGHEKGAFTGAVARRKGKFEEASGGTLLLDEIGEMDIVFQAKLLRVLQEKEVTRIGSNSPVKVDCRILVATNRNLQEEVKAGNFREDLYYRLFGLPIHLPPLRERGKDVLVLAKYFADAFCKDNQLDTKKFDAAAQQKLLSYQWPGNIRELKSIIDLAVVMCTGDTIVAEDITLHHTDALPNIIGEAMTLREYNIRIVNTYMEQCSNDTKLVAEKLGIGQTTVYRLLKEDREGHA